MTRPTPRTTIPWFLLMTFMAIAACGAPRSPSASPRPSDGTRSGKAAADPSAPDSTRPVAPPTVLAGVGAVASKSTSAAGRLVVLGEGTLQGYFVRDSTGKEVGATLVGNYVTLPAATYSVEVNGVFAQVTVVAGQDATVRTGTLLVHGNPVSDLVEVYDQAGHRLVRNPASWVVTLLPGALRRCRRGAEGACGHSSGQASRDLGDRAPGMPGSRSALE